MSILPPCLLSLSMDNIISSRKNIWLIPPKNILIKLASLVKQPQCSSSRISTKLIQSAILCGVPHREQKEYAKLHFLLYSLLLNGKWKSMVFVLLNPAINTMQEKITHFILRGAQ